MLRALLMIMPTLLLGVASRAATPQEKYPYVVVLDGDSLGGGGN